MKLYRNGTQFSSILTITGDEVNAQAATCHNYLQENIEGGLSLLQAIQGAWNDNQGFGTASDISVNISGPDSQTASISACGSGRTVINVACAFAWFCCAVRPIRQESITLSTFAFTLEKKSDTSPLVKLELLPLRQLNPGGSCWHKLFKKIMIVSNAPTYDRAHFSDPRTSRTLVPKGLDVPFDVMVKLAAVNYPIERDRGVVLKGFNTLLVATAIWTNGADTAIQWHFVSPCDRDKSMTYSQDEKHQVLEDENAGKQFEAVSKATRTFIGWGDTKEIHLSKVNRPDVDFTEAAKTGRTIIFKNATIGAVFGQAPVVSSVNMSFEVQSGSLRFPGQSMFHEMIVRSTKNPILLFAPEEKRGWLVPRLFVLECMAHINIQENGGLSDSLPPSDVDAADCKDLLLKHLSHKGLTGPLTNGDDTYKRTIRTRELLLDLGIRLDWAEDNAKIQLMPGGLLGYDTIYGLDFLRLALGERKHDILKFQVGRPNGNWVQLLNDRVIDGVIFCSGLGEVITCDSACQTCTKVPKDRNYVAAVMSCLSHLSRFHSVAGGFRDLRRSSFENSCTDTCFHNHVQDMATCRQAPDVTRFADYPNGVVVFGEEKLNRKRKFWGNHVSFTA